MITSVVHYRSSTNRLRRPVAPAAAVATGAVLQPPNKDWCVLSLHPSRNMNSPGSPPAPSSPISPRSQTGTTSFTVFVSSSTSSSSSTPSSTRSSDSPVQSIDSIQCDDNDNIISNTQFKQRKALGKNIVQVNSSVSHTIEGRVVRYVLARRWRKCSAKDEISKGPLTGQKSNWKDWQKRTEGNPNRQMSSEPDCCHLSCPSNALFLCSLKPLALCRWFLLLQVLVRAKCKPSARNIRRKFP